MSDKSSEEKYLKPEEVSRLLKVTPGTLGIWATKGLISSIRTKGGHRRYKLSDITNKLPHPIIVSKRNIIYCRVSTSSQKEDLERQVEYLRHKYPDYECIKDIGSGINFKRKGLNSILDSAVKGDIGEVVVTHKDRLCRFGFELIQRLIEHNSNGKIVVLDQEKTSPQEELVNDLISIITVFSSRIYGLRSRTIKNKIKEAAEECEDHKDKIISDCRREEKDEYYV